jgi:hypothetical protein
MRIYDTWRTFQDGAKQKRISILNRYFQPSDVSIRVINILFPRDATTWSLSCCWIFSIHTSVRRFQNNEKQRPIKYILHTFLLLRLYSPCGPWSLFQFPNLYTVGRTRWTGDQPVARPLPTQRTTQTQNKRTQTCMPWVGFEPKIPASERGTTIHTLDREVTVIGILNTYWPKIPKHGLGNRSKIQQINIIFFKNTPEGAGIA